MGLEPSKSAGVLFLAAHVIVESDRQAEAINVTPFREMDLAGIVHLSEDAAVIASERLDKGRIELAQKIDEIEQLQEMSEHNAQVIAQELQIPSLKIYGRHRASKLLHFLRSL